MNAIRKSDLAARKNDLLNMLYRKRRDLSASVEEIALIEIELGQIETNLSTSDGKSYRPRPRRNSAKWSAQQRQAPKGRAH